MYKLGEDKIHPAVCLCLSIPAAFLQILKTGIKSHVRTFTALGLTDDKRPPTGWADILHCLHHESHSVEM